MSKRFQTGYMDKALFDLPSVIERASEVLADVEFDTIVGTGFSGGVVIPSLAMALGKKFVLVRKDDDDSHHSGRLIGELGERWIFVDDFISSGKTREKVIDKILAAIKYEDEYGNKIETTMVGQYMYVKRYDDEATHFEPFQRYWYDGHFDGSKFIEPEPEPVTFAPLATTKMTAWQQIVYEAIIESKEAVEPITTEEF